MNVIENVLKGYVYVTCTIQKKRDINVICAQSAFFKKKNDVDIAIASIRPSRYLLLNHWAKSNHIWCVSCSKELGAQRHNCFAGPPGALVRGQKVKYH